MCAKTIKSQVSFPEKGLPYQGLKTNADYLIHPIKCSGGIASLGHCISGRQGGGGWGHCISQMVRGDYSEL